MGLLYVKNIQGKNINMNSNYKVHELIDKRWSPRAFSDKNVDTETLFRLFEAARRAPSCSNEQPWRFVTGVKGQGETWDKIYSVLNEFNQLWSRFAPVLCLVTAQSDFQKNGTPNRHKFYDCGQAVAYLTMQATAEGLYIHQMAGFDAGKAAEVFSFPQGFEPITVFALGYLGKPEILPERMQKDEHFKILRKNLDEIFFSEWNKPFEA
jgi:nitroreductase